MKFKHLLIKDLSVKVFLSKEKSLFRHYQNIFLERYGPELIGTVIELGCEKKYRHQKYFLNASAYICSNIDRDYDEYVDITKMNFDDNSQDAFICVSVLEHVQDIHKAISEIERTLKPGGKLLLTIPFAYPYHDDVDFWRLSIDAYYTLFKGFEIKAFIHLGGLFSSIADNLKRPKGVVNRRYLIYKTLGLLILLLGKKLERIDGMPLGYGIYAEKK